MVLVWMAKCRKVATFRCFPWLRSLTCNATSHPYGPMSFLDSLSHAVLMLCFERDRTYRQHRTLRQRT